MDGEAVAHIQEHRRLAESNTAHPLDFLPCVSEHSLSRQRASMECKEVCLSETGLVDVNCKNKLMVSELLCYP